jgi:2-oxoglutarate dehydrogenase E2 component (dihydrolipoamide succinyltransferase)
MTNVGSFGNVMGTPIINQPQVAIMAVGAIRKKPAVIETPQGDTIGIRHMMFLIHELRPPSGGRQFRRQSFIRRVADYLEQFDPNQRNLIEEKHFAIGLRIPNKCANFALRFVRNIPYGPFV